MKKSYNRWLCFLLVGVLLLPGCASGVAESSLSESSGEEITTTTTTTTTELSTITTTTTIVAVDGEILAPKEQWPDADKQQLQLQVAGESLALVFDRAMLGDGQTYWHYTGKTKRGHSVSCKVLDERIVNVYIAVTGDNGDYLKEEEVRTFLLSELKELGFGESFEQVDIFMQFSMLEENKHNTGIFHVFLPGNERLHGSVCRSGGRIYLRTLSTTGSDQTPKLTEHEFDYLIPHWC